MLTPRSIILVVRIIVNQRFSLFTIRIQRFSLFYFKPKIKKFEKWNFRLKIKCKKIKWMENKYVANLQGKKLMFLVNFKMAI